MLVDVAFKPVDLSEDTLAQIRKSLGDPDWVYTHPKQYAQGIYIHSQDMSRLTVEKLVEDQPPHVEWAWSSRRDGEDNWDQYHLLRRQWLRKMNRMYSQQYRRNFRPLESMGSYGVCDTPEQLLEYFPHLADDDVPRVISVVGLKRENQYPDGGFRYHKSGQYIGKQRPRHEYFYDDTHIDLICLFHIYRVEPSE